MDKENNFSNTIRYIAGDRIVKLIFTQSNDLRNREHIENRVIILDELFSTNIRRFKGDAGIKVIVDVLYDNAQNIVNIARKDINDISNLTDNIVNSYRKKTMNIGNKGCMSFVTKYLFWHLYSEITEYDNRFYTHDRLVAKEIKFKKQTNEKDFYLEWYNSMNKMKEKCNLTNNNQYNNREIDLYYWNLARIPDDVEQYNPPKTKKFRR